MGQGKCLFGLAYIKNQEGQLNEAYDLETQSMRHFERLNSQVSYLNGQIEVAKLAEKLGRFEDAYQHYELLYAFFKQAEDVKSQAFFLEKLNGLKKLEISSKTPPCPK